MLDEYLALGGVELGNNARAYDYASCLSCCAGLLKLPGCDGIHDATTGFTDAVREWQTRFTNLYTNPSFETVLSTMEVRRNYIPDPRFTTTLWGGVAAPGGGAVEFTSTGGVGNMLTGQAITELAGATVSSSYFVENIGALPFTVEARIWDNVSYATAGAVTLQPGESRLVKIENKATAGTYAQPRLWQVAPTQAGAKIRVSEPILEKAPFVGPYFDGGVSPDSDLTPSWSGAVDNSASTLSGGRVSPSNTTAIPIRSSQWSDSGDYSLRMIPNYPTAGSGYIDLIAVGTGLVRGQIYTAIVTVHKEAATPNSRGGIVYVAQEGPTSRTAYSPNAPGDYTLSFTFTPGATGYGYLRLYHGGAIGEPDIWFDSVAIIPGDYSGDAFDGSNLPSDLDPDVWRTLWSGAQDASTSFLQEDVILDPAESSEPPYSCDNIALAPWYDQSNPFSQDFAGFYLLSVKGITDGTMTAGVTESIGYGGVIGAPHYATRSVRVRSMLVGCGRAATHYGLAWLKAALGESFCSRHGDACGTSDLAFFIDCPPPLDPGETDYAAATAPYRRYLHDVACTSAPIIAEEYETMSGAYVVVVEYILTAESPFVWGQTFEAESTGAVLTAYDDIPFNLMRRPSGEQGDGIPAVVATQYAFNGSAEYGGSGSALPTGWAQTNTIGAAVTSAKSSDIAAVGPNSARLRLLATAPVIGGSMKLYYDVALGSIPAGSAPSVSIWAAALSFAGSPVSGTISAELEWRTASATVSTAPLGQIPLNGGNISAPGLTRPPTATVARLAVTLSGINAQSGDDIRLYADAFGLTVP